MSRAPVSRTYAHIRATVERHVAWIEFNRPPVNAFTRPMVDEYAAWYDPSFHIDISPELVGYKPVRLDSLIKGQG